MSGDCRPQAELEAKCSDFYDTYLQMDPVKMIGFYFRTQAWHKTTGLNVALRCLEEGARGFELLDMTPNSFHPRAHFAKQLKLSLFPPAGSHYAASATGMTDFFHLIESRDIDRVPRRRL